MLGPAPWGPESVWRAGPRTGHSFPSTCWGLLGTEQFVASRKLEAESHSFPPESPPVTGFGPRLLFAGSFGRREAE